MLSLIIELQEWCRETIKSEYQNNKDFERFGEFTQFVLSAIQKRDCEALKLINDNLIPFASELADLLFIDVFDDEKGIGYNRVMKKYVINNSILQATELGALLTIVKAAMFNKKFGY